MAGPRSGGVVVFDHTIHKQQPADLNQQTTVQRPAVLLVQSDCTPASSLLRVRDIAPDDAKDLLKRSVGFHNLRKQLYSVEQLPLATIEARRRTPQPCRAWTCDSETDGRTRLMGRSPSRNRAPRLGRRSSSASIANHGPPLTAGGGGTVATARLRRGTNYDSKRAKASGCKPQPSRPESPIRTPKPMGTQDSQYIHHASVRAATASMATAIDSAASDRSN